MILLDTCVASEAIQPKPSPDVLRWLEGVRESGVFLPSIVVGELQKGVDLLPPGKKRDALRIWLEQLRGRFAGRIVPVDEETAVVWGMLTARMQQEGRSLPVIDSLLAATALRHHSLLATRNTRDFDDTGVEIVDPWSQG